MIEAMLLAAGFSTRLHPLTCDIPKPMLPFLNRKLLDFTVGYLSHFGIKRLSTNAHHGRTPFIKELSMHHALNIHPFIEDSILGTGGGIQNMRSFLTQDDFMVINCDFVCDINLKEAYAKHKSSGAIATLVLVEHEDQQKYGEIGLDDRGQIVQFPKQNLSTTTPIEKGMFSGIHFLNRKIFDLFPNKSSFCIVRDVYQPALEKGITFNGYLSKARWLDVGEVQKYATAQFQLLETPFKWMTTLFEDSIIEAGKAPSNRFAVGNFSKNTPGGAPSASEAAKVNTLNVSPEKFILPREIEVIGKTQIGQDVRFAGKAKLEGPVILGDHTKVGKDASLKHCIVFPDTTIQEKTHIENAIVTPKYFLTLR